MNRAHVGMIPSKMSLVDAFPSKLLNVIKIKAILANINVIIKSDLIQNISSGRQAVEPLTQLILFSS